MTPTHAKIILAAMKGLSNPDYCAEKLKEIWGDDPDAMDVRKEWPQAIAAAMQSAIGSTPKGGIVRLAEEEVKFLSHVCGKRGVDLEAFWTEQPAVITPLENGDWQVNVGELRKLKTHAKAIAPTRAVRPQHPPVLMEAVRRAAGEFVQPGAGTFSVGQQAWCIEVLGMMEAGYEPVSRQSAAFVLEASAQLLPHMAMPGFRFSQLSADECGRLADMMEHRAALKSLPNKIRKMNDTQLLAKVDWPEPAVQAYFKEQIEGGVESPQQHLAQSVETLKTVLAELAEAGVTPEYLRTVVQKQAQAGRQ